MPEINLLPDELRGKEKKEIRSTNRKSGRVDVAMSNPNKEVKTNPSAVKKSRPSLLSRLFAQPPKIQKGSDNILSVPSRRVPPKEELHIPQDPIVSKKIKSEVKSKNIEDPVKLKGQVAIEQQKKDFSKQQKKGLFFRVLKFFKLRIKKFSDLGSNSLDVNLIPENLARFPAIELPKIYAKSGSIIFSTVLLVLAAYLGLTFYQINISRQTQSISISIASLDKKINSFDSDKKDAMQLQTRIGLVKQLLSKHIYWTEFFELLEKYTIKNVYYVSFSMAGREKLVISAIGEDYSAVARQLVVFEAADDFIKTAEIEAASAEIDSEDGRLIGVSFNISLEFMPDIFLKPIN